MDKHKCRIVKQEAEAEAEAMATGWQMLELTCASRESKIRRSFGREIVIDG